MGIHPYPIDDPAPTTIPGQAVMRPDRADACLEPATRGGYNQATNGIEDKIKARQAIKAEHC